MIVVTGATGQLGSAVVEHLLRRVPASEVVASVRDRAKAATLAARGIEVRTGDFADPDGLARAFAGADRLLIVSADKVGDEARRLHRAAIEAARRAGVRHVFYTSHAGARAGSPFLPADQHAATEADLARSGMAYTSLRHGFYAESCLQLIADDLCAGELRTPEDGPVAWTARADLAAADAAILASGDDWGSVTPPLTARRAVTMAELAELAELASVASGRAVRHVVIADAQWRDARIAAGVPAFYADMLLGVFKAAREGDFAATDPALETLLGRPPRAVQDVLAAAWRPSTDPDERKTA